MARIQLAVGTRVYVSAGEPATYDTTGFNALSYTEVGKIESIGEYGGSAEVSSFTPLNDGIVDKLKGSIDYGSAALSIGRLTGDVGQGILKDGFDGNNRDTVHSFKIINSDGATAFFTGLISSFVTVQDGANNVIMVNCNVELNNKVLSDVYDFVTLTYNTDGNGTIIGDTPQTIISGGDGEPVYASANDGYTFSQWSDGSVDNPRQDLAVSADLTVTAQFVV